MVFQDKKLFSLCLKIKPHFFCMQYKVAIIDDDIETLHFLTESVKSMRNFECTFSARTVQDFIRQKDKNFQFLILDLGLPEVEKGLEGIVLLKEKLPDLEIIILTSFEEDDLIVRALSMGASGYLFKSEAMSNLEEELDVLLEGGAALSPIVARKIIGHFNQKTKLYKSLNAKEHQILKLLANGNTYEEIGEAIDIKIDSVRYYIKSIYKKLHVNNRSSAIQKYFLNFFR
jgi:DNA-binding NarL/FixJ family response regulator